jgi:hypothetical protein
LLNAVLSPSSTVSDIFFPFHGKFLPLRLDEKLLDAMSIIDCKDKSPEMMGDVSNLQNTTAKIKKCLFCRKPAIYKHVISMGSKLVNLQ